MLCVAGGKGGVGKTTTAAGLARAGAADGARPVVVDADRDCPDLAHVVGVPARGLAAFADGEALADCGRAVDGVRYLCATGREPDGAVRRALERLRRGRRSGDVDRPVLVDAPAGAGRAAALPLRLADRAVVVTSPTARAQRDALKTAAMARALDAAVVGALYVRGSPSGGALDCRTLATVPASRAPLEDDRIRDVHGDVWTTLDRQNV